MKRKGSVSKAIVYILNREFLDAFKVSLYSLQKHNNLNNISVVVFYYEEDLRLELQKIAKTLNLVITPRLIDRKPYTDCVFDGASRKWTFSPGYRFEVFDLKFDEVLYIDCDTLICGDIASFFEQKGDFCACPLNPKIAVYYARGKGFNAGIFLVRKKYLNKAFKNKLIKFCKETGDLSGNQVVLNFFFKNKTTFLPQKYNVTTDVLTSELLSEGLIFHFVGELKPWGKGLPESYNEYILNNTGLYLLSKLFLRYKQIEKESSLLFNTA
jgi:lipopolysaccharide biosynthesis glycosyltransferase